MLVPTPLAADFAAMERDRRRGAGFQWYSAYDPRWCPLIIGGWILAACVPYFSTIAAVGLYAVSPWALVFVLAALALWLTRCYLEERRSRSTPHPPPAVGSSSFSFRFLILSRLSSLQKLQLTLSWFSPSMFSRLI